MKLLVLAVFLIPTLCKSRTILTLDPRNTIYIRGVINGNMLPSVPTKIISTKGKRIFLVINSPGGSVPVGTTILDAMNMARASGKIIYCFSPVLAASMAFNILASCDHRYVFRHTKLLFHPISVFMQGPMRVRDIIPSLMHIYKQEELYIARLVKATGMNREVFMKHYLGETRWTGESLKAASRKNFLRIVDGVINVEKVFEISPPSSQRNNKKKNIQVINER